MTSFKTISPKFQETDKGTMFWFCPGCKVLHPIYLDIPGRVGPKWNWNGSLENPTFSPSFLTQWKQRDVDHVCHTFIREGKVQYLGDCTHELKNTTIDLPDLPDDEKD